MKKKSPFRFWFWEALLMGAGSFWLANQASIYWNQGISFWEGLMSAILVIFSIARMISYMQMDYNWRRNNQY